MAGARNSNANSVLARFGLRPVTKCNLVQFYVPVIGVTSYTALSVNIMNPGLIIRIFPKKIVTNFLLGSAFLGTATYICTREHMKKAPTAAKVIYSATGALLLSFGSVLVWSVLRFIVPPNPTLCTMAGIGSGLAFIKIGSSYLDYVDAQVAKKSAGES